MMARMPSINLEKENFIGDIRFYKLELQARDFYFCLESFLPIKVVNYC